MTRRFAHTRLLWLVPLLLLLCGIGSGARADTYTVTSTDDDGPGTLRQAILDANAHPGADVIVFSIDPGGPQTIQPLTPLPALTDTTQIAGGTQPGFVDTPVIELDGSLLAVSDGDGLRIAAPDCQISALVINRFGEAGVYVTSAGSGAQISGCYLGTDVGGATALGNTYGLALDGAANVLMSGSVASGNGIGVSLFNNARQNRITGCLIGTDFAGIAPVGNIQGVTIDGGGGNALSNSVICASLGQGVVLSGGTAGNSLSGNMIGVDLLYLPVGNGLEGVDIADSPNNAVMNNLIAANAGSGIVLEGGGTTGSTIQSSTILANAYGIEIRGGSAGSLIGGNTAALGCVLSGNVADGVTIYGAGSSGSRIQNSVLHGNGQYGVSAYTSGNSVTGCTIDSNALEGVFVGLGDDGAYADHVAILGNRIFDNGDLGIFLDTDGVTGGNDLQPAPVLSQAIASPSNTFVIGSLVAAPNTTYRVEIFDNQEADASGFGEGETYLGAISVTTDAGGSASFTAVLPPVSAGDYLSATATDPLNNTSAFALSLLVGDANPGPTLTAISPANILRGSDAFKLTLSGSDFVPGSTVRWNGQDRATTFVSPTLITAVIAQSDLSKAGAFAVTVYNPAPGGGESNALTFTVNNPAPALSFLSPASALAGSAPFTLTVTGSNFEPESVVQWNGVNRATTYVSATQLTIAVSATDLASAGTASVTVSTPAPGGGQTGALTFSVTNPAPTLASLSPNAVTAGASGFTMTLTGTNFLGGSQAQWNGSPRPTAYLSPTQLQIAVPRSDIANAGTVSVTVVNPSPGGGASNALPFTVNGIPQLSISAATVTRNGVLTVTLSLKNIGTASAPACKLTVAKLDVAGTTTVLPLNVGDLAAGGAAASVTLTFPGTVGAGAKTLSVTLTSSGKTLTAARQVAVP